MDALDLKFQDGSFDAVWSVVGAHMNDKTRFADELLRTLRPEVIWHWLIELTRSQVYPPSFLRSWYLNNYLNNGYIPNL